MKINVTEKARIYANERRKADGSTFTDFTTSVGKQKQDGSWENAHPRVQFAKCQPPQIAPGASADIIIDRGFMAFDGNYTPKANGQPIMRANGKPLEVPVYKVVVMQYHFENAQQPAPANIPDSFAVVDDDEAW